MEKLDINQVYIVGRKEISDGRIAKFFENRGAKNKFTTRCIAGLMYHVNENNEISCASSKPKGKIRIYPWGKTTDNKRKFPREMMVSDDKRYWVKRVVFAKCRSLNYPYIAASPPYRPEDEFQIRMRNWKYAKEID